MEQKDNGDWLSAQQAVRPDGSEVTNLPLINKKLPPLVATNNGAPSSPSEIKVCVDHASETN
ncbi:hypothetical protein [Undibacterium sp. Di24W]|uniref:hypothetical protein n=1 Tax=Undibacterium sp. Di24W TaxID=3413033 RepID=UPI003BF28D39